MDKETSSGPLGGDGIDGSVDATAAAAAAAAAELFPLASAESPPPPSTVSAALAKRSQLSAREKLRVVEWYHANGRNQQATAAHFKAQPGFEKLSQSTVSRYIAAEPKIRELVDSGRAAVVRVNAVRNPDFENVLLAWLDRLDPARAPTGDLIKQTAARVYDHLRTPKRARLELSNGWLRAFQLRHGMKSAKAPRRSLGGDATDAAAAVDPAEMTDATMAALEEEDADQQPLVEVDLPMADESTMPQTARYSNSPLLDSDSDQMQQYASMYAMSPAEQTMVPARRVEPTPSMQEHQPQQQTSTATGVAPPAQSPLPVARQPSLPQSRSPALSVPDAAIKREQERVATSIRDFLSWDHRRSLGDVWTLDEVPLSYACFPGQSDDGSARKRTLTVALATNADGSERREPLIIGRTARPSSFKSGRTGGELGFAYRHNRGAWMTADVFFAWLEAWNAELMAQSRHVLLLVDSHSGHKLGKKEFANIQLEYFGARLTEIVQPFCDAVGGVARAFKACYRRLVVLRAADRMLSAVDFADRQRVFEVDQLAAMELVVRAWPLVLSETIARCWRNAKILPMDQSSRRTDVRPAKLLLPELQALQEAMFFLSSEAHVNGVVVALTDASVFVDVDSEAAGNDEARLEGLVQFTVGGRQNGGGGETDVDENLGAGLMDGDGEDGGVDFVEGDADDCGSPDLNPVQVYRSLLTLEQCWREKSMRLSDEVLQLMQMTRVQLQKDIIQGREQQDRASQSVDPRAPRR